MNEAFQWINTLLLLFLLWFQWNRNKTLSERIDQQTKLLQDTKSVVTQQATALESQAKVVETAVRYSEAFDPAKMEAVLRKQVEIESYEKIFNFEKQYQKELSDKDERHKEQLNELLNIVVKETSTAVQTYFEPLQNAVIRLMVRVSSNERDALIAEMSDSPVKDQLSMASKIIDSEYTKALACALLDHQPQQGA